MLIREEMLICICMIACTKAHTQNLADEFAPAKEFASVIDYDSRTHP